MIIYIQRLILTIDTRAGKGLRRVAINGLKDVDGKPVTEGQRIGSQHSAWDTWILEEWKSNVYSSELQKLTRNAITRLSAKFPQLADSAVKQKCIEVLTLIGSLHSKLSREYGLSGFIFDETMFDFLVKVSLAVSGVLQPPVTTQLDQQQSTLKKGCLSKQKASKNATSFTASQQPKFVWAPTKPSFEEIYAEDKQQNSPWFAAPGAVLHFGLFCMDSLPRLRAECISWLFHYGV